MRVSVGINLEVRAKTSSIYSYTLSNLFRGKFRFILCMVYLLKKRIYFVKFLNIKTCFRTYYYRTYFQPFFFFFLIHSLIKVSKDLKKHPLDWRGQINSWTIRWSTTSCVLLSYSIFDLYGSICSLKSLIAFTSSKKKQLSKVYHWRFCMTSPLLLNIGEPFIQQGLHYQNAFLASTHRGTPSSTHYPGTLGVNCNGGKF